MKPFQIALVLVIALGVIGGVYYFLFFPGSQLQLNFELKNADNPPVNDYLLAETKKCGVWFEESDSSGNNNAEVTKCLEESVKFCNDSVSLLIKEQDGDKSYSFLRTIGRDNEENCVLQISYHQDKADGTQDQYINTCKELAEQPYLSCPPKRTIEPIKRDE